MKTTMTPIFEVQVSAAGSIIYTFATLAEALRFAAGANGTVRNEYGTILQRGSWDKKCELIGK